MSNFTPKTNEQLRAIFGLGKERQCEKSDLEELAADVTNGRVERLSLLSFDEANAIIKRLGGDPFPAVGQTPRRTENHRRQKAGVVQIVTKAHLDKLHRLADKRGITAEGLKRMCMRMLKTAEPKTTVGCNKVIEAIKAMNNRDAKPKAAAKKEAA